MLLADVCVGFICCYWGSVGGGAFRASGCSLESCAHGECLLCLSFPKCLQDSGYGGVPIAGHAHWWGHSLRDSQGVYWVAQKCARLFQGGGSDPTCVVPTMLALAGQPSLRGHYACMVLWAKGAFWRNCRQNLRKTSFSRLWVFSVLSKLFFLVVRYTCLASVDW